MPRNHPFVDALFDAFKIEDPEKKLATAKAAIDGIKQLRALCLQSGYLDIFNNFKRALGEDFVSSDECMNSLPSIDSVDCRNDENYSPLMKAVMEDDYPMFKLILDNGADINFQIKQYIQERWVSRGPLMKAILCEHPNYQMIKDLLAKGATYNENDLIFVSRCKTPYNILNRGAYLRNILDEHKEAKAMQKLRRPSITNEFSHPAQAKPAQSQRQTLKF